jgi:RecB family endonuclease NucS
MDGPRDGENESNAVNAGRRTAVLQGITQLQRAAALTYRAPTYPQPMQPKSPAPE